MSGSSAVRRLLPVSRKQLRRSWRYINAAVSPVHFNNPSPLLEEQSRGLRVRSFLCSAPGPATTEAQVWPQSDRDDLPSLWTTSANLVNLLPGPLAISRMDGVMDTLCLALCGVRRN
ncbi:hypothetical protein GBAR_LOCUS12075 [Geodia barretti]|uniref:Uncharacterized protein n=1 Tax=Geodia barretti TaxID=519541 RepID=A0AA35RZP0_GEOBA|nr:hypothetical protein GBAR_LOCUS12075 [Geodia barretti]